jgi:hypothetical protein
VGAGDDDHEAYTAIMWSGILSRERDNPAEAETVTKAAGNMLRTVMRGATTLPWSETPLRMKGTRRNLGDLISPKPPWRGWAATGSRRGEAVVEEARSRTAA